jgi:hypothetical protein
MGRGLGLVVAGIAFALVSAGPARAEIAFFPPTKWPTSDAQHVVIADFNKDGTPDLAAADSQPAEASVLLGTGNAAFGTTVGLPLAGHPHEVQAADFNGDTNVDLALSEQETGNVAILLNAGDGSFRGPTEIPAAGNAYALAVGDVNVDGKADLVVGDNRSSVINVLLGDGAGNFAAPSSTSLGTAATDVVIADMNKDTKPDLVVSSSSGGTDGHVAILLGAGDGSFTGSSTNLTPDVATSVAAADFNGDGNLDVAAGVGGKGVEIWNGDGAGATAAGTVEPTPAAFPTDIAVDDLDRDGTLDIAAIGGELVTLRGQGGGQSVFFPAVTHQDGGVGLAIGKVDSDVRPDVVTASNDHVGVFVNVSSAPPPPGPPPLLPPVVGKTANVTPVKGTILVKQPGKRKFIRLEAAAHIRVDSELDATKGTVRLTSAAGGGKTQSGLFNGGRFKIGQKKGKRPFTDLTLTAQLRCVNGHKSAHVSAKRRRSRRLFGNAHGRFRTRGRHSVATIRGTKWLVKDTCSSTLTRSIQGTVVVQDLVKHRTVKVKSGRSYVARADTRLPRRGNR